MQNEIIFVTFPLTFALCLWVAGAMSEVICSVKGMTLIKPIYLDTLTLAGYAANIEGGLRKTHTETTTSDTTAEGGINYGVTARGGKTNRSGSTTQFDDHDISRLKRLIKEGEDNPEDLGWVTVLQPGVDLKGAGTGAMVQWECDIYVPNMVANLQKSGGLSDTIDAFARLLPAAEAFGLTQEEQDLPKPAELSAMQTLIKGMDIPLTIIGEDPEGESEWKIFATLKAQHLSDPTDLDALDGPAICIGKVSRIIKEGSWHPLITLPGMSRAERRKQEKARPEGDDEENYVQGPAVFIEMLAIYN